MSGAGETVAYYWMADGKLITSGNYKPILVVTEDMIGKKISVEVVSLPGGETATSEETAEVAVEEDLSDQVTITDEDGFQVDGTALPTDKLALSFGVNLGVPKNIVWYCNGAVMGAYSLDGGDLTKAMNSEDIRTAGGTNMAGELKEGEWYVTVENTVGTIFTSDSIFVAESNSGVVYDLTIEDDYSDDGVRLTFDKDDATPVMSVTLNKDYEGILYIYKDSVVKYDNVVGGGAKTNPIGVLDLENISFADDDDSTLIKVVTKKSQLTAKNAIALELGRDGGIGSALKYVDKKTGEVTYMFVPGDGTQDTAATTGGLDNAANDITLTRGTEYKVAFDQYDIEDDDISATARDDIKVTESVAAPYLEAPASIEVTSFSTGTTSPKVTIYGDDDETITWINDAGVETIDGFDTMNVYKITTDTIGASDKATIPTAVTVVKGVATLATATLNTNFAYAKFKTTAGVFGADSIELVSPVVETAIKPYTKMELTESSDNASDAVVKFTGLRSQAPGTVYIMQGDTSVGAMAGITQADFLGLSTDDALGSAHVDGAASKVTITGVFKNDQIGAANDEDQFMAVFVPDNTDLWLTTADGDGAGTAFQLVDKLTSYELVAPISGLAYGTTKHIIYNKAGEATNMGDVVGGTVATDGKANIINSLNQFGKVIDTTGTSAETTADMTWKLSATTSEDVTIDNITLKVYESLINDATTPGTFYNGFELEKGQQGITYTGKLSTGQTVTVKVASGADKITMTIE